MGRVLNIQRFSTEDGPGIRTTVFLQGCFLRCKWCQNPESWDRKPHLVWYSDRCIAAQNCLPACPKNALALKKDGIKIDRCACNGCGECALVCPAKALEILGKEMSFEEVLEQLIRDLPFYEESDGGVTLSGGDPLFQPEFSQAILQKLQEKKIHTAIDTAGYSSKETFSKLVNLSDLILFDLKQMDQTLHKEQTEISLERIIQNAKWLGKQKKKVWIRTPIIATYTDQEENILAMVSFIKEHLFNVVERWDLLTYNNLSVSKWKRLDLDYELKDLLLISREKIDRLAEIAKRSDVPVTWSGVLKKNE